MKKKVVVIMGGISSEREVSLNSGKAVLEAIDRNKYDVYELIIDSPMDVITKMPSDIDFALIVLHGKYGEDGTIQAILESMNIPYSGCDTLTSSICMNKNMTKKILKSSNIPTAPWVIAKSVDSIDYDAIEKMGYPVFIKPNNGGSSVATFKIDKKEDVYEAVKKGLEVDDIVIIESFLPGGEYTSFVLNGEVYPTIKITSPNEFFDYESKYATGVKAATEEVIYLEESLQNQINTISEQCWEAFNCKAFVRVDLILSDGIFYVLELNTIPGMTKTSLIPKSANARGLSYSDLLDKIIEYSL